jgi:hypothetical protein
MRDAWIKNIESRDPADLRLDVAVLETQRGGISTFCSLLVLPCVQRGEALID